MFSWLSSHSSSVKKLFLGLIGIAAVLEAVGDIVLKKWAIDGRYTILLIGLFVYLVATMIWAWSLKYDFLSRAISTITIINLIIVVLAGVFLFNEDLSITNKIGIALGILSVIMIQWS